MNLVGTYTFAHKRLYVFSSMAEQLALKASVILLAFVLSAFHAEQYHWFPAPTQACILLKYEEQKVAPLDCGL